VSFLSPEVLTWLLVPASVIAGMVNVIAGGGSFLTLPLLIATGLPADVANGTNRLAVMVQAFVAGATYKREGKLDWRLYWRLLPPLLAGALVGATLATWMNPERLELTFGILFLLIGAGLVVRERSGRRAKAARPAVPPSDEPEAVPPLPIAGATWKEPALLFVIGIYGGFLQAGVALFILLISVRFFGHSALRINAIKLPLVMTFTVPAFVIFVWAGQVRWWPGLLLAAGSSLGSFLGVRMTMHWGEELIMRAVTVILIVTGIALVLP